MTTKIKTIAVFAEQMIGDWLFRLSISDHKNYMLFCINPNIQNSFMVRYFSDVDTCKAFIDEVAAGKHLDEI